MHEEAMYIHHGHGWHVNLQPRTPIRECKAITYPQLDRREGLEFAFSVIQYSGCTGSEI